MFKIHSCTDRAGFIHINLDAGQLEHAPDCDEIVKFSADHHITTTSTWLTGWNVEGGFNWKTAGAQCVEFSKSILQLTHLSGVNACTKIGTTATATKKVSFVDHIFSLFRSSRLDFCSIEAFHLTPATTVLVFPNYPLWVMLSTLPVSVEKSKIQCDIFTTTKETLTPKDEADLRSYLASRIQDLEERYAALRGSKPMREPPILPMLKAHLKLERLAGSKILPGRREEGRSASFCKAEQGELLSIRIL